MWCVLFTIHYTKLNSMHSLTQSNNHNLLIILKTYLLILINNHNSLHPETPTAKAVGFLGTVQISLIFSLCLA